MTGSFGRHVSSSAYLSCTSMSRSVGLKATCFSFVGLILMIEGFAFVKALDEGRRDALLEGGVITNFAFASR